MANRSTTRNLQCAVTLFVLLLALDMPRASAAWSMSSESLLGSVSLNLQSAEYGGGLALHMMHHDHVDSKYAQPHLTVAERMKMASQRSKARVAFIHAQMSSKSQSPQQQTGDVVSVSESYNSSGAEYVVSFSLGTPPREFQAIADTGSGLVWVECEPCYDCLAESDPKFNPKYSSSYKPLNYSTNINTPFCDNSTDEGTCLFQIEYDDGSLTQGDLAFETLTLTSATGSSVNFSDIVFGCAHTANGTGAGDGIVGFDTTPTSLVSQLGPEIGYIFSFCLVDFVSATHNTSSMLLGSAGNVTLKYTPLVNSSISYAYYVNVTQISVNNETIDYPSDTFTIDESGNGGMILDTGTQYTTIDNRAFTPLVDRLNSLIPYPTLNESITEAEFGLPVCYNVSGVTNPTFPSVTFHFDEELDVVLPTDNVFLEGTEDVYCLSIDKVPQGGLLTNSIFGNSQMQNFQIAFDLNKNQVGFAHTTC